MKLLHKHDFEKHRDRIIAQLNAVPFNTLFAKSVVKGKIYGDVFTDDTEDPQTFYILHPYGMSLLLGKNNDEFNKNLAEYILNRDKKRNKTEWMQTYPDYLGFAITKQFKNHSYTSAPPIEPDIRVNFKFNLSKHISSKQSFKDENIRILRTSKEDFENVDGSVSPKYFWNNADEFINNGVGYTLFYKDSLASVAFSSVIDDKYLELGIETQEEFREKNLAYEVCTALISYCLENGFEPVWACRKTNIGSYKLAEKLGFEESLTTPYYKLNY